MNNKLSIILFILIIGTFSLSIVSANESITIDGIDFNIPDGYHKVDKNSSSTTTLQNDAGDEITIRVSAFLEPSGVYGENITIAGKKGVIRNMHNNDGESKCEFVYSTETHGVDITASNQETIEKVIK